MAYEAADCGLLSPDLAAGIRRVKGVKKIGVRLGNWLTADQSQRLWQAPGGERLKGKRDRALLAVLLACGLRRHEAVELSFSHIQQRENHWSICRSEGKGRPHPHHPGTNLGKECPRRVASGSEHHVGQVVSSCAQDGKNLGREADGEGCVARGSGVCGESQYRQIGAARPPPNLRTPLPHCGRGTGANPVFAWAHFDTNNGAVSWLQAAHSMCRQRQNRNRATGLNAPLNVRFADDTEVDVVNPVYRELSGESEFASMSDLPLFTSMHNEGPAWGDWLVTGRIPLFSLATK